MIYCLGPDTISVYTIFVGRTASDGLELSSPSAELRGDTILMMIATQLVCDSIQHQLSRLEIPASLVMEKEVVAQHDLSYMV